jgi:hypothetical protein
MVIMQKTKEYLLVNIDVFLAAICSFGIWVILAKFAPGGPLGTDILLYMNAGINHVEDILILNRYFHVYLEGFFLRAAPTPLIGIQYYWAFLMAATAFLVYYNARSFTGKRNLIHGVLGVGLFFSVGFFATKTGVVDVDLSAMFMLMIIVTIFMASAKRQHRSKWLLILLGALFYLAFKTKETTLVSVLLFIGLGFQEEKFQFKVFIKNIAYLLVGILAGIIFFAMLSWVMLGDPLFGLRPKEIYDFIMTYVRGAPNSPQQTGVLGNWYTAYFLQVLYIPFMLYVLAGIKPDKDLDPSHRLLWWLPLGLIVFVSLSANITWGPRFLMPAIPIISVLAPQFLNFEIPNSTQKRFQAGILIFVMIVLLLVIRISMRFALPKFGVDNSLFLVNIYEPVIFSTILAIAFFWKRISFPQSAVITILIIALIVSPLSTNFRMMFLTHPNQVTSQTIFYPFSAFSDEINFTPNTRMLISLNTWQAVGNPYSTKNVDEVMDLFNVYFNANSTRSNYTIEMEQTAVKVDILNSDYDYVLISMGDWQFLSSDPLTNRILEQKYQVYFEPRNYVVLLKEK